MATAYFVCNEAILSKLSISRFLTRNSLKWPRFKKVSGQAMHFRSNVRYIYREFDSIFLPRSSPKYSRTTIRAYFLLYFRHEAYYARWSSHNWSLGRVCVYIVTLVVKEQENWPHWCPKHTSREKEDSCNRTLFLETWPWDTCGVNFLVVHVRARYVCGKQSNYSVTFVLVRLKCRQLYPLQISGCL